jgi:hypothetical protein
MFVRIACKMLCNVLALSRAEVSPGGDERSAGMENLRSVQTRRISIAQATVERMYITTVRMNIVRFCHVLRPLDLKHKVSVSGL